MPDEDAGLTPTAAAEWPGKDAGFEVELPSGGVARIRRPPLSYYLLTGRLPAKLWARVQKEGSAFFGDPMNAMTKDELRLYVDWMIACSFVEPEVTMARKTGAVYVGDLSDDDKGRVMELLGLSLG